MNCQVGKLPEGAKKQKKPYFLNLLSDGYPRRFFEIVIKDIFIDNQ